MPRKAGRLTVGAAAVLAVLFAAIGAAAQGDRNGSDRATLEAFYHATGGPNWFESDGWLTGSPLRFWKGVSTGEIDQGNVELVDRLSLWDNNLSGSIPAELGQLAILERLDLSDNNLSGPIPAALGQLAILEDLLLHDNNLSGPIPAALGQLVNLESLSLGSASLSVSESNDLSGPIPAALGQLVNLESLFLAGNNLSGPIPAELGQLANLETLYLRENNLSGPIPAELGQLANLNSLYLSGNNLSGPIPVELGQLALGGGVYLDADTGLCLPPDFPADSRFAEFARSQGVPDCDESEPLWCPVTPQSSCQVNAPNSASMATGAANNECVNCNASCEQRLESLQRQLNIAEIGVLVVWCLVHCPEGIEDTFWDTVGECIPFANSLRAATLPPGLSLEVYSSDPGVLEVVTDSESVTMIKRSTGPVELRVVGRSDTGQVAKLSYHMVLGSAVPALPWPAILAGVLGLLSAGLWTARGRRQAAGVEA